MTGWWTRLVNSWRRLSPLGGRGERVAARWLKRRGYEILQRNSRVRKREVDLLALAPDGRTVVLVEVKTRTSDHIAAEFAIDRKKRRRMTEFAALLQRRRRYRDRPIRFDVITIHWPENEPPRIRHYPNAFDAASR